MAEPENQRRSEPAEPKLFTLSEISQQTGISMPTLQRYKKLYQGRIPSEGEGRKQRYPESALPVFDEIKNENVGRRGRPRKDASAPRPERPTASKRGPGRPAKKASKTAAKRCQRPQGRRCAGSGAPAHGGPPWPSSGRPAKAAAAKGRPARAQKSSQGTQKSGNLLTLTQISETTGISYPTLVRYVRLYADRLPHEGKGRARRFYPQAVDVFRQLRSESGRGGRKKGSGASAGRAAAAAAVPPSVVRRGSAARCRSVSRRSKSPSRASKRSSRGSSQNLQKLFR